MIVIIFKCVNVFNNNNNSTVLYSIQNEIRLGGDQFLFHNGQTPSPLRQRVGRCHGTKPRPWTQLGRRGPILF